MTPIFHAHAHTHIESLHEAFEVVLDAATDSLKALPFLFLAFLLIEFLEHKAQDKIKHIFVRAGAAGPLIGALAGCIPQCGFSVMSSNLYSSGIISLGTLIAVFLSTSDEAVILLATEQGKAYEITLLLITKLVIALIFGYLIYFIEKKKHHRHHHHSHDLCEQDHCGCDEEGGVLRPAIIHTVKVFGFLLLFTIIIDLAVALIGTDALSHILLSDSALQPLLSALIGFIPSCASSILLTQLYIEGTLSFGAMIAGLCTNAGAGLLILFRNKSKTKENFQILGIMYLCSVVPGMILHLISG